MLKERFLLLSGRGTSEDKYSGATLAEGKTYIVYRVRATGQKVPVGELVERRRTERKDNPRDMLRLARKMYSSSTLEAVEISVEPTEPTLRGMK